MYYKLFNFCCCVRICGLYLIEKFKIVVVLGVFTMYICYKIILLFTCFVGLTFFYFNVMAPAFLTIMIPEYCRFHCVLYTVILKTLRGICGDIFLPLTRKINAQKICKNVAGQAYCRFALHIFS